MTNKNVGKGRRKKTQGAKPKFVPEIMIKQFHRDMSQSSIQNINVSPPPFEDNNQGPSEYIGESEGIININLQT